MKRHISHTLIGVGLCIKIINLHYLSEDSTGLSLLIHDSWFVWYKGTFMEKHKFSFIALRDYLKVNNPEVVFDFDKTISNSNFDYNTTEVTKGDFVKTVNNYLSRISNNEKLFNAVQYWKYAVLRKAEYLGQYKVDFEQIV